MATFSFVVYANDVAVVKVESTPPGEINSFDPDGALGSSVDVLTRRDIDQVYTPHIIQESLSAGWGPITYRNNSELRMAAWALERRRNMERSREQERLLHRQHRVWSAHSLHLRIRASPPWLLDKRRSSGGLNLSYWKSNLI